MARQLHTLEMNPRPAVEDALTVPRAKLDDDGYIEIGSSAFLDESAPPEAKRAAASLIALGAAAPRLTSAPRTSVPDPRAPAPSAIPRTNDEAAMASVVAAPKPAAIPPTPEEQCAPPPPTVAEPRASRRLALMAAPHWSHPSRWALSSGAVY